MKVSHKVPERFQGYVSPGHDMKITPSLTLRGEREGVGVNIEPQTVLERNVDENNRSKL